MHRNAPLTPQGRLRLCQMIEEGWTIASSAESMRISRQTAHKWWRRYLEAGEAGLADRSSRPRRCPTKTPPKVDGAWWSCAGAISSVRPAWPHGPGSQPRHCTGCCSATE